MKTRFQWIPPHQENDVRNAALEVVDVCIDHHTGELLEVLLKGRNIPNKLYRVRVCDGSIRYDYKRIGFARWNHLGTVIKFNHE